MPTNSPYAGVPASKLLDTTRRLIGEHPLKAAEIVEVVQRSWADIFASSFGPKGFKIGTDIFPKPQIMGFFLHELIPLELATRYPKLWRPEKDASDKDVNFIPDPRFSFEIKTSSHKSDIFGNRSYAQETVRGDKKSKSGFYLTVNFGKFGTSAAQPTLTRIRFGWLDHTDWIGQAAASGQQAHLTSDADQHKLIELHPKSQL
ncbi:MAG: ScaI family restriction endonuclease [Phycisphaerae bacterium]|nr:ScaI family restriction endonuclease [Phycisphaerae bacterium]